MRANNTSPDTSIRSIEARSNVSGWVPWKIIDRLLLPIVFFLLAFVVALTLWQLLVDHRRVEIQAETHEQATFLKSKIESELAARSLPLEGLAEDWSRQNQSNAEIESEAELIISAYPQYQAIAWLDPNFRTQWVKSPHRRDSSDLSEALGANAREAMALRDPRAAPNPVVSRPVDLGNSNRGLLICVSVYSKNVLRGFLVGAVSYNEFFSSVAQGVTQGYWLSVYDGKDQIYGNGDAAQAQAAEWAQAAEVHFQQLTWRVDVRPKPVTVSYALPVLPQVVFIGGILMAALVGFTVYLAETSRLHLKSVAAVNRKLQEQIAAREQTEQALREAQKMEAVGQLAGGVAHDFNNLLMVIHGHALLASNRSDSDAPLRRELKEIMAATDRASFLTRRLLAFSRKQVLQLRVFDLNGAVNQIKDLLPPVLGEDIQLIVELDPDAGRVKADSAQIEQVIMNLAFNARDAMPGGGELIIRTGSTELDDLWVRSHAGVRPGPHVMLEVADSGHGMDEQTLSHVFEPFFTTKPRTKGTGLGLATVYGAVRQFGGCITVSSKVGEGTTFQIYLPQVEEEITADASEPSAVAPRSSEGSETILVVEDDHAVRRMTREFLKIKGYCVVEARTAAEAIQIIEHEKRAIDLVLTDVLMPGMKGPELVERLGLVRNGIKVLFMSAYTEDAAINVGVLNPGMEFIEKPFGPDDLASKVRDVLSGTHASNRG